MSFTVYDFGNEDGVQTYRVSGVKEDLQKILEECERIKAEFVAIPTISHVRHGLWTMLLRVKVGGWRD